MKIILDTNTIIASGWQSESICRRVIDLILYNKIAQCYVSPDILEEYTEISKDRKFRHNRRNIERQIRRVMRNATRVVPRTTICLLSDPDDDKFLELAHEIDADYLISGDIEAFGDLQLFEGTHIVTAADFLSILDALDLI
ncbi:MAG: putative PIN family toxin of toxin-antitoxin system [Candidatus Latescibacterota bacterium]|jgi:putative PIN family toxin of toxin-antitoxin system